jgi:hypothetical protein
MDIEQLKLVLEAAAAAGDSAMTIAIIFMAKDFIIDAVMCAMFTAAGVGGYRLLKAAAIEAREHHQLRCIAQAAGTSLPLNAREMAEITRRVTPVREQQ